SATPAISQGRTPGTKRFSECASRAFLIGRETVESMLMELASLHFGPADRLGSVSHVRHAFDMRGLRKHVQGDYLRHFKDIVSAQKDHISGHRGAVRADLDA